ncbi:MAG: methionyl-tRNA formyltransferase [Candidatus Pacebacteria bacterium]|nr:methionyl-tRNA formyltransferase [Candidatus Paceibacterota bacterium]
MNAEKTSRSDAIAVYFLGSGVIAVPALTAVYGSSAIRLVGVGTQPDRRAGRRKHMQATPFGEHAEELGLEVDKPCSVNDPEFLERLRVLQPEIVVVAAFGQLLKAAVLKVAPFGCLNIHASLLPRHRGAAPVSAAIIAGDETAGISFMQMDEGLDTGPVYAKFPLTIRENDTAEQLEQRLAELAASHVVECMWKVCREGVVPDPQDDDHATRARKLKKSDGEIDWTESADLIERKVRAYIPWPRAHFWLSTGRKTKRIQVMAAAVVMDERSTGAVAGEVIQADRHGWRVQCGQGVLDIQRVIPEGRHEMTAEEFLRGATVTPGTKLDIASRASGGND